MADIKWKQDGLWGSTVDAFAAANFNALANNGGILSSASPINNSVNKHQWGRLSFNCVTSTWAVSAGGLLAFYLLPRSADGTTYPNSANGTGAANYPGISYWKASITFRQATLAHVGVSEVFPIPPGYFLFYVANRTGAALPGSATNMTCQFESLIEEVA